MRKKKEYSRVATASFAMDLANVRVLPQVEIYQQQCCGWGRSKTHPNFLNYVIADRLHRTTKNILPTGLLARLSLQEALLVLVDINTYHTGMMEHQ
jgi:hypothetical protein